VKKSVKNAPRPTKVSDRWYPAAVEDAMARIELQLLGGFEGRVDGERPLTIPTWKARLLLAVLALAPGERFSRQRLAGLLWSDRAEPQARSSLRQALTALRKALEPIDPCPLVIERDGVLLRPGAVETDVAAFEALAASDTRSTLRQAVDLYRGDLLAGATVRDPAFEEWLSFERERRRERVLRGLRALLSLERQAGEDARAIEVAQRYLALDPAQEETHRALIRLYAKQNRLSDAIRQYRTCVERLRDELDVAPEGETERLYGEILRRRSRAEGSGTPEADDALEAPGAETLPRETEPRPSIAILPFVNLSEDPAQAYFSDGITEDIITALSRFRNLAVIAPNSSFRFRGPAVDIGEVARKLGVDYVVGGSVRKSGKRMRITAQLVDAASGTHVWAERYDRDLEDIFAVQDDVVQAIVGTLPGRLDDARLERLMRQPPQTLTAYDHWLRGMEELRKGTFEGDAAARPHFRRSLECDPHYARAYSGLALSHFNDMSCRRWSSWKDDVALAVRNAETAVAMDDRDHLTHGILGMLYQFPRDFGRARMHVERSYALNPNDADNLAHLSLALAYLGDAEVGIEKARTAMRLNPYHDYWYQTFTGICCFIARRYEEGIDHMALAADPGFDIPAYLAASHAYLGQMKEARRCVERYREICRRRGISYEDSGLSGWVPLLLGVSPFARKADADHFVEGLRRAGLE
jgi:TolB-like protein/Tfp pilus assembly protein PilF